MKTILSFDTTDEFDNVTHHEIDARQVKTIEPNMWCDGISLELHGGMAWHDIGPITFNQIAD